MKDHWQRWLPWVFAGVFALTRYPGILPGNFSAAYALVFCAGAFFPGRTPWRIPVVVMLLTDLILMAHYQRSSTLSLYKWPTLVYLGGNYVGYAVIYGLGRWFKGVNHPMGWLGGGILGALVFYFLTNSMSWLLNPFKNPEYTRDLAGWITALTLGTKGHPPTWEFFRNTLLSGGLFSALFGGAWKFASDESPQEKGATDASPEGSESEPGREQPRPSESGS